MKKIRKSVFAKRRPLAIENFWRKPIFEIFGIRPHFFWYTPPLCHFVTFGRSEHPKIGTSKCPHARPRAPPCTKLSRDPPTTIPRLPCNFGGDCMRSEQEIREKHDFGRVPPPIAGLAPRVPQNTKIEISRKLATQSF